MTRRNLSDILRQEVKKDTSDTSAPEAQTASAASKASAAKNRKAPPNPQPEKASNAVETQLTAQVTELKAALAQGVEHEKELQGQIKALQSEVKRHQKEVASLEAQDSKLKAELAEAKAVILQLSEANTQMSESLDALKAPKAPKTQPQPQRKTPLSLRPLPSHSVQHSIAPSGSVSNPKTVDVGWMD
jgi:chromosome segregation ATPase